MTTESHAFFSAAALRSKRASCNGVSRLARSAANLSIIHVELFLGDIALHRLRQPIANRVALRDRPAKRAARDIWSRPGAQDHAFGIEPGVPESGCIGLLAAGPGDDDDRREASNLVRLMPARKQARGVPAQDQEQLIVGKRAAQLLQRVDRVGKSFPTDLDIRDLEPGLPRDRKPAHLEALGSER